jgi:adenylate kinase
MAHVIIVHGPTRAGKSSQVKRLAEKHGYHYISSGEAARAASDPAIRELMAAGKLIRSEDIERLMKAAIEAVPMDEPILIDGFPRKPNEFKTLLGWLKADGRELKQVIELYITPEESHRRGEHRGRVDDEYEAIESKWQWYRQDTQQVLDACEKLGLLQRVDGIGSLDEVAQRMEAVIIP